MSPAHAYTLTRKPVKEENPPKVIIINTTSACSNGPNVMTGLVGSLASFGMVIAFFWSVCGPLGGCRGVTNRGDREGERYRVRI